MWTVRKNKYALAIAAAGAGLALLAPAASATGGSVSGLSASNCYGAEGWYEYNQDGSAGGYPKYDTETDISVGPSESCSWIDNGVLQYSGLEYRSGTWRTIQWKNAPADGWGGDIYNFSLNDVRDIRFRVCNIHGGITDGCGRVS